MKSFTLYLQSAAKYEKLGDVTSFVGEDDSGSFGILPGHARMMTVLLYGLARFKQDGKWIYLAFPGGVLYFVDDALYLTTRRYFMDPSYQRISAALLDELLAEEESLKSVKENIYRLEQEMLRRLWQIQKGP